MTSTEDVERRYFTKQDSFLILTGTSRGVRPGVEKLELRRFRINGKFWRVEEYCQEWEKGGWCPKPSTEKRLWHYKIGFLKNLGFWSTPSHTLGLTCHCHRRLENQTGIDSLRRNRPQGEKSFVYLFDLSSYFQVSSIVWSSTFPVDQSLQNPSLYFRQKLLDFWAILKVKGLCNVRLDCSWRWGRWLGNFMTIMYRFFSFSLLKHLYRFEYF